MGIITTQAPLTSIGRVPARSEGPKDPYYDGNPKDNVVIAQIPFSKFVRVPTRGYGKKKLYYTGSLADLWEEGYKSGANTALTKESDYLKIYQNNTSSQGFWATPVNFNDWDTAWIDQTFTGAHETNCNICFAVGAKSDSKDTSDRKLDFYRATDGERRKIPFHVAGLGERYLRVGSYNSNSSTARAITQQIHNVYLTSIPRLQPDKDGFIYKPGEYEYNWTVRNNGSVNKRITFTQSRIEMTGTGAKSYGIIASAKPITPSEWDGISIDWDVTGTGSYQYADVYNRFGVGTIDASPAGLSRFANISIPTSRCTQRVPLVGLTGTPYICAGNNNTNTYFSYNRSALIYGIRLYRVPDNIVGALGLGNGQLLWDGVGDDLWGVHASTSWRGYTAKLQGENCWTIHVEGDIASMGTVKQVDLTPWNTLHVLWEQTNNDYNCESALAVGSFGHSYGSWTAGTEVHGPFGYTESTLDVSSINTSLYIVIHIMAIAGFTPMGHLHVKRVWLT